MMMMMMMMMMIVLTFDGADRYQYSQWYGYQTYRIRSLPTANVAVLIRSVSVCVCVYRFVCLSCSCPNHLKPWLINFIFDAQARLQNIQVKFVCQGHRVKVKVTGAINGIY